MSIKFTASKFPTIHLSLVREQAGKRLPQVSDGLGLGFVLIAGTEGLAKGIKGIGQGLGFTEKETQTIRLAKVLFKRIIMSNPIKCYTMNHVHS